MKFLQPLKSEQSVTVELEEKVNIDKIYSNIKFRGVFNGIVIAQGELKLEELS